MLLSGCGGSTEPDDIPEQELDGVAAPIISGVTLTQNPSNVLSATLEFETDQDCSIALVIRDATGNSRLVQFVQQGKEFSLPVLGLRAETKHTLEISATNQSGITTLYEDLVIETDGLPDGVIPPIDVMVAQKDLMEPGVTLFSSLILKFPLTQRPGLILGLDQQGEVIWYYRDSDNLVESICRTHNGNLLFLAGVEGAIEIDMMGKQVAHWKPTEMGILGFHHDIIELPNHNLAAIGVEMKSIEYTVDGQEEPISHNVVGDLVVEFERNGNLVNVFSTFDFLDPAVYKEDFHSTFWDQFIPVSGGTKDWTHTNGLVFDPKDDSFILSVRHLDWLVKIDRSSGNLVWLFGEEGDFELEGPGKWLYHPHAPQLLDNGNIMLFDNGNLRPGVPHEKLYSRAVEYSIDEANMTARQVWEYQGAEPFYSQFVGDADRLPNGNVLISDGGRVLDISKPIQDPSNIKWCRLFEVTDDSDVVWEAQMKDLSGDVLGYTSYRAIRVPSLYPETIGIETIAN